MKNSIKKEWSKEDFKLVQKAIVKFINSREFEIRKNIYPFQFINTFKQIDSVLGLAYTSSSDYAGYFICNTELYLDEEKQFSIQSFVLDSLGYVYIICWDEYERELIISISK